MNPDICPSALEEDGTLDRTKWDGAHKWDTTTDPHTCAECGTARDVAFRCPLCTASVYHTDQNGTHIYSCNECPFLALEWYTNNDTTALISHLNTPIV